jgi:hypothetical protein
VYIQNQNTQQIEKWKPWNFQLELLDIINSYDLIYILKASQLGISWLIAIYNDWVANFSETSRNLLLSQGGTEAEELLDKVKFVHNGLPDFMRMPTDSDNRTFISMKGNYAEVRALASTDKAGHGFQGSVVTRDEVARHEWARDNFKAVSRAIDSGGKLIELSTANKKVALASQMGYFQEKTYDYWKHPQTFKNVMPSGLELYINESMPGSCLVFLNWRLRPVRYEGMDLDDWWNSRILTRYTTEEIEEQYPTSIEDVFRASTTNAYFEQKALDEMSYDCDKPKEVGDYDTYNGIIRYYKPPLSGRNYVQYTDPTGGKKDPFVSGVMDTITGEVVCSATGCETVTKQAQIHDYIARLYNTTNSYEANAIGNTFGDVLDELKTPKQAVRVRPSGEKLEGVRGLWVDGRMKNDVIMPLLAFEIAHRQIVIHDREFVEQAYQVLRDKDNAGSEIPDMDKKKDFDWVMMMAGLVHLRKRVPRSGASIRTYSPNREGEWKLAR